ncbi:hypothetical protein KCU99_g347, partial [Aureobasidium melanogenum]
MLDDFICFFCNLDLYYIFDQLQIICTYGHSQLKTGHPVRSAIHKQLNGRLFWCIELLSIDDTWTSRSAMSRKQEDMPAKEIDCRKSRLAI